MIAAIIQARMGSTRSPGKVLRTAAGKTLLAHLIERLGFAQSLDQVIVATSIEPRDAPIADLCTSLGVPCFRGSETDVLDRYYQAASAAAAETVVRITADCPLVDPAIVDEVVGVLQREPKRWDLVTNRHPLTFPDGMDVDAMPMAALRHAWNHASTQSQREHVIPFFWETGLRVRNVESPVNHFYTHRWTVDYDEDVELVSAIFDGLYTPSKPFTLQEILDFVSEHPELCAINARHLPVQGAS
jgi:spore coat polysaccharide biosynthesis protein SpsF